jgi:DUF971 family protein
MTQELCPTEIILHKKSRTLEVLFNNNERFIFPCEYLRVFSPSAETKHQPVTGKENVNILSIEPVGQYAIKPTFSDGHSTGIFSWKTLYELGVNMKDNWKK